MGRNVNRNLPLVNITQVNVVNRFNLTATYEIFVEKSLFHVTDKNTQTKHVNNLLPNVLSRLFLYYESDVYHLFWLVSTHFGYHVLFESVTYQHLDASFSIFEEPTRILSCSTNDSAQILVGSTSEISSMCGPVTCNHLCSCISTQ